MAITAITQNGTRFGRIMAADLPSYVCRLSADSPHTLSSVKFVFEEAHWLPWVLRAHEIEKKAPIRSCCNNWPPSAYPSSAACASNAAGSMANRIVPKSFNIFLCIHPRPSPSQRRSRVLLLCHLVDVMPSFGAFLLGGRKLLSFVASRIFQFVSDLNIIFCDQLQPAHRHKWPL